MVSLRDIGPLTRPVTIRDKIFNVTGITAHGLVVLMDRFPPVRKMLASRGTSGVTVDDIVHLAPDALAAVVAAGLGDPGNPELEKDAQDLMIGEVAEIVAMMLEITFSKGLAHFQAIVEVFTVGASGGTGRVQDTKLPSHFNSAFRMGTPQKPPGTTPPVNSMDGQKSSAEGTQSDALTN